jgi:hypothetical protein
MTLTEHQIAVSFFLFGPISCYFSVDRFLTGRFLVMDPFDRNLRPAGKYRITFPAREIRATITPRITQARLPKISASRLHAVAEGGNRGPRTKQPQSISPEDTSIKQ